MLDFSDTSVVASSKIGAFVDVIVEVGDREFTFSSVLLRLYSDYFHMIFNRDGVLKRVKLPDCNPIAVNSALNFILAHINDEKYDIDDESLNDIIHVAHYTNMRLLLKRCDEYVLDHWSDYWDVKSINAIFLAPLPRMCDKILNRIYEEPSAVLLLRDVADFDIAVITAIVGQCIHEDLMSDNLVQMVFTWIQAHVELDLPKIITRPFIERIIVKSEFLRKVLQITGQTADNQSYIYKIAGDLYLFGKL